MRRDRWHIIGRGLCGWHAQAPNVRSSGGDLAGYLADAIDGCVVYDARQADEDQFTRLIYRGPMADPGLEPDGWSKFWHDEDQPKALDSVGVTHYRRMLATVPGMRLGTVARGIVAWDDQPALPGAEHVRTVEAALPQFELPAQTFELTPPPETPPAQPSLLSD